MLPERITVGSSFLSWPFCLDPINLAPCTINAKDDMPRVQIADRLIACLVMSCYPLSDIPKANLSGRAVLCLGNVTLIEIFTA